MKQLVILRGNSGSGKTTVAKALQQKLGSNTMLISQDVIRREMLMVKEGEHTPALPLMQELLQYGSIHSEIVILEGIMYADWYRPLFDFAVSLYGEEIYAYYFDLPFEETMRRHQTKPNCNEFGEEAMQRWWREKDYSDRLQEVRITAEQAAESIVDEILRALDVRRKLQRGENK